MEIIQNCRRNRAGTTGCIILKLFYDNVQVKPFHATHINLAVIIWLNSCRYMYNMYLSTSFESKSLYPCSLSCKINSCYLTHWGGVTHIWVTKLTIIGSGNVLSSGGRQAIIGTNVGLLLIGPLRINFSEILITIEIFSLKKYDWKCMRNGSYFVTASVYWNGMGVCNTWFTAMFQFRCVKIWFNLESPL